VLVLLLRPRKRGASGLTSKAYWRPFDCEAFYCT